MRLSRVARGNPTRAKRPLRRTLARVLDGLPVAGNVAAAVRHASHNVVARLARAKRHRRRVAGNGRRPRGRGVVADRRAGDLCQNPRPSPMSRTPSQPRWRPFLVSAYDRHTGARVADGTGPVAGRVALQGGCGRALLVARRARAGARRARVAGRKDRAADRLRRADQGCSAGRAIQKGGQGSAFLDAGIGTRPHVFRLLAYAGRG